MPAFQLPWPTNTTHRINFGNTYGCDTHDDASDDGLDDYWAIDFEFARNEPVTAVADGTANFVGDNLLDGYGTKVVLDHWNGNTTLYAHLVPNPPVANGTRVNQGQVIGYADDTGHSGGDHLHFVARYNGVSYAPEPMSGQGGFGNYGACRPPYPNPSPYWISRPVRWPAGDFYTPYPRADVVHLCCDGYAHPWQSNGNGLFTLGYFNPRPGYNMNAGSCQSGQFDNGAGRDLIHLCCSNYVETWLGNGNGTFALTQYPPPPGNYGVQAGSWQAGRFLGGAWDSLVHLCCPGYVHFWTSQENGNWTVGQPWSPWPGYGVQSGTWLTGDFDGDARTDLFHAWGGDSANIWYSQGNGTFDVRNFSPSPGYAISAGQWRVADFNGDGRSDLAHLYGASGIAMWRSTGSRNSPQFTVTPVPVPPGGYGVQQGQWLAGHFNVAGGWEDLIHICCAGYVRIWLSNGDATFTVSNPWAPWGGYGMLDGSWHRSDFTGDGRTDLLHAWGGSSANTWKANSSGTFDVTGYTPQAGYCMLC